MASYSHTYFTTLYLQDRGWGGHLRQFALGPTLLEASGRATATLLRDRNILIKQSPKYNNSVDNY